MTKLIKIGLMLAIIIVSALFLRDCTKKYIPTEPKPNERLKENEKERISINDRGDVVKTVRRGSGPDERQVAYRDTGAGETTITIDKQGNVKVTQQTSGFVFRPGLCISTARNSLLVGTDVQFYYYRNFGANVGLTAEPRGKVGETIRAHIAGSYRLPFESFRNTSIYVGYDTKAEIQVGARVRF